MRILVCECKQEVSSFNPALGGYDDFVIRGGEEFLSYHRPLRLEEGGALSVFDSNPELIVVPGYSARPITSSGTLADADFSRLTTEFIASPSGSCRNPLLTLPSGSRTSSIFSIPVS